MKMIIIHCNGSWKQSLHTVMALSNMEFDENVHYSVQWKLESCTYRQSWLWPTCSLMKMIIIHSNGSWKQCLHTAIAFEYMVFDENDHYSLQWRLETVPTHSHGYGLHGV